MRSHTADLELPIKLTPFFSLSQFYRYYVQSAAKYFSGYQAHAGADEFYTSNYDLAKFRSDFLGIGMKYSPPKGIFGLPHFHTLELRYGHYSKDIGLDADLVSINIKYR